MITEQPIDMTKSDPDQLTATTVSETSPPPLTRIISAGGSLMTKQKTTPSSPKDFFAKLYGPSAAEDKKSAVANAPPDSPPGMMSHFAMSSPAADHQQRSMLHQPCLPASSPAAAFLSGSHHLGYPSDAATAAALFRLDTLPFPGGLAAFRKYL